MRGEDEPEVILTCGGSGIEHKHEVPDVLRKDRSPLRGHEREQVGIADGCQVGTLGNGNDIVSSLSQLLGYVSGVVLVEDQPQARTSCSRRHACSSRPATSWARPVQASISSLYAE